MRTVDQINRKFGRDAVGFAATGWKPQPAWRMRQTMLSPRYTTRASDFPIARC